MSDIDRTRMIPLHIADQAVAACDAEIQNLREENARLKAEVTNLKAEADRFKAEVERLTDAITRGAITPDAKKFEPAENDTDYLTVYLYAAELSKDAIKKLKQENAFLKMEVERLKNNCAYLDTKLDEELDK